MNAPALICRCPNPTIEPKCETCGLPPAPPPERGRMSDEEFERRAGYLTVDGEPSSQLDHHIWWMVKEARRAREGEEKRCGCICEIHGTFYGPPSRVCERCGVDNAALAAKEKEVEALKQRISEGIVSLCVCENAASPRPDCPCVTCTVKRAEGELRHEIHLREYHEADNARLRGALEEIGKATVPNGVSVGGELTRLKAIAREALEGKREKP